MDGVLRGESECIGLLHVSGKLKMISRVRKDLHMETQLYPRYDDVHFVRGRDRFLSGYFHFIEE